MARKTTKKNEIRFADELILNRFLLNQIGFEDFKDLSNTLKPAKEGWKEDGSSYFYDFLINSSFFSNAQIDKDTLLGYDMNIARHTKAMQGKRPDPIVWKYFQWACLLFAEMFLDKFFTDSKKLVQDLNAFKQSHAEWNHIPPYTLEDINKVAVWNATGSGKTLLMHVNLLQYKYYLAKHHKEDSLNKILLITPNEGLSRQHLDNFNLSQIPAEFFDKNAGSLFSKDVLQIIDINKLKEEGKVKTISVESFEDNNLVFVDEVHKGSQGEKKWKENRDKLSANGFAFEYSATLGQAIKSSKDKSLEEEYAKTTLFDYSYKWFYEDGYGKDYRILNLKDDTNQEIRNLYLVGCLLSFYQQLLVWESNQKESQLFNIEKPLWVFVGATVTAVRKTKGQQVSDVLDVLLFLADFVSNKQQSIASLDQLLERGMPDTTGKNIFSNTFRFVNEQGLYGEQLYNLIMNKIFHASSGGGVLHLKELKGNTGEISLCIGENEAFGLINVGDAPELLKLCRLGNNLLVSEQNFSGSMFDSVKNAKSPINILIGSKKFTEGWDCFRVSTMGLMNVGVNEGSEIIQLFGRGVRLKGYKNNLKRSSALENYTVGAQKKDAVRCLETLNIFGVRANYMDQFKAYLQDEGLPEGDIVEFTIPVLKNFPNKKLKIVRLKGGVDFKKNGEKPTLQYVQYVQQNKVQVDWYPKIQMLKSHEAMGGDRELPKETHYLTSAHLAFMDWERLYLELEEYKAEKSWYNLNLNVEDIKQLFNHNDWYELYIPREDLRIASFADFEQVYDIALTLLKKYCDKFYTYKKSDWEKDKLEYCEIKPDDNNFIEEYKIYVRDSEQDVIARIKELESLIKSKQFKDFDMTLASSIYFDKHLYNPLLLKTNKNELLEVKPVPLNEGEGKFVTDLRGYCQSHKEELKDQEVYLLRNRSKVGIGFFEEGGFFPDFILWIIKSNVQRVVFIDPKGTRNLNGKKDPKIMFYQRIKEIERQLQDSSITLDSFILSVTDKERINWALDWNSIDFITHHILFQKEEDYIQSIFQIPD